MTYEFKLPDIGEGVSEGEILKWMVREGEQVNEDQPLVEVMTDKVNVQIPSPRTGTVARISVKEGEIAKVGQTIVVIEEKGGQPAPMPANPQPVPTQSAEPRQMSTIASPFSAVLAAPATRRLARELEVDIATVKGTGPQGRVTDQDVQSAAAGSRVVTKPPEDKPAEQAHRAGGPEELIPLRGLRRTIAERMLKSSLASATVTHVDEADVTELIVLREALKSSAEKRGVKLTFLPLIVKALVPSLKEFPYVNSSMDEQGGNIILKKYYNFGIATDTEQGLIVPVVKDADRKDVFSIAGEIEQLATKSRSGQLGLDDVRGSTFTITNVGSIGGLFATPIINQPEVAILGTARIEKRPVVRDGKVEVRDMMYLSLSFDHRVFDGAYAARFTTSVIETLQDTKKLLSAVL
ncbi:MAG TPA: dihydrolipoamide acetyltransferase family protein [Nitrososphaerales archaeon]|nr:dihydrolipoamide acetyltransferase family protein [Nitrososphaerales archaeon]